MTTNNFYKVILNEQLIKIDSNNYYHYLYKITNITNNHFYYGVHSTKNLYDNYKGSGTRLKKAYKKYGLNNFIKEIIQYFDNEEEMFNAEYKIVNESLVLNNNCYNLSVGGGKSLFNQTICKDKNGNIYKVFLDDIRIKTGELIGIAKNTITVKTNNNEYLRIPKQLFDNNKDIFSGVTTGKIIVHDKYMNTFLVDKNDPRLKSGELIFLLKTLNKNKTTVKDKNGVYFRVDKNDPRLKSGELIGVTKNNIKIVKDNIIKTISPEELEKYEAEGWKKGSLLVNKIIVSKNNKHKFISPEELEKYEAEGWKHESINKGKLKIIKDNIIKTISPEELEKYEAEGWKHSNKSKGKISIYKNNINKKIYPEELEKYEAEGWKKGFSIKSCSGKIAIHNANYKKFISPEELEK